MVTRPYQPLRPELWWWSGSWVAAVKSFHQVDFFFLLYLDTSDDSHCAESFIFLCRIIHLLLFFWNLFYMWCGVWLIPHLHSSWLCAVMLSLIVQWSSCSHWPNTWLIAFSLKYYFWVRSITNCCFSRISTLFLIWIINFCGLTWFEFVM